MLEQQQLCNTGSATANNLQKSITTDYDELSAMQEDIVMITPPAGYHYSLIQVEIVPYRILLRISSPAHLSTHLVRSRGFVEFKLSNDKALILSVHTKHGMTSQRALGTECRVYFFGSKFSSKIFSVIYFKCAANAHNNQWST